MVGASNWISRQNAASLALAAACEFPALDDIFNREAQAARQNKDLPGRLRAASATMFRGCKLELLNDLDSSIACLQGSTPGRISCAPFQPPHPLRLGNLGPLLARTEVPIIHPYPGRVNSRHFVLCPFISTRRKSPGCVSQPRIQCVMFSSRSRVLRYQKVEGAA